MNEYNKQLKTNLQAAIYEFNNKAEFAEIRQLYKNNFDKIVTFIKRSNSKLAVEDIASLDSRLASKIFDHILLLQEINKAILQNEITLSSIK